VFDVTASGVIGFGNGGDGKNAVKYAEGDGALTIWPGSATGTLQFGAGITADDVLLQTDDNNLVVKFRNDASDSVYVHGDLNDNAGTVTSSINKLQFSDGTVVNLGQGTPITFTWLGTPNSSLSGSSYGANVFEFGQESESATGSGTANGRNGNNTYLASTSTGQATINPNEASGSTNELDFTGGITDQNLWFIQSGNNLNIDLLGTNTNVTVNGWFSSSSNQLQEITAGGLKLDSQISQLVQAMATYPQTTLDLTPPRPVSTLFQPTAAFRRRWLLAGIIDAIVRSAAILDLQRPTRAVGVCDGRCTHRPNIGSQEAMIYKWLVTY
jgi:hypothetical protein